MPDIKIKPQMYQPKVRVVNNTPKDAGSILKKEYAERQKEKQPDTKGPVQYATDRVETTGRRGTVAAADGMRRVAKKARDKKKATTSSRQQEQPTPPDDLQAPHWLRTTWLPVRLPVPIRVSSPPCIISWATKAAVLSPPTLMLTTATPWATMHSC